MIEASPLSPLASARRGQARAREKGEGERLARCSVHGVSL